MKNTLGRSTTSTSSAYFPVTGTSGTIIVVDHNMATTGPSIRQRFSEKQIENAVYGHIQAVRALGKDKITTTEIADALSLPHLMVIRAVEHLKDKGVSPIA